MSLSLHTIRPAKGATKKRKRVGRGNASGHGTSATRGTKGQTSRTGVSGLKRLGMKSMLLSIPKKRGFNSLKAKHQVVNLLDINKHFKEGETVNPKTLIKKGLIEKNEAGVKILGKGELKVKGLKFEGVKMSETVKKLIS